MSSLTRLAGLFDAPAVIHFVPLDSSAPFPWGTEGFAGESGTAAPWCEKPLLPGEQSTCTRLALADEIPSAFPIRLALNCAVRPGRRLRPR